MSTRTLVNVKFLLDDIKRRLNEIEDSLKVNECRIIEHQHQVKLLAESIGSTHMNTGDQVEVLTSNTLWHVGMRGHVQQVRLALGGEIVTVYFSKILQSIDFISEEVRIVEKTRRIGDFAPRSDLTGQLSPLI